MGKNRDNENDFGTGISSDTNDKADLSADSPSVGESSQETKPDPAVIVDSLPESHEPQQDLPPSTSQNDVDNNAHSDMEGLPTPRAPSSVPGSAPASPVRSMSAVEMMDVPDLQSISLHSLLAKVKSDAAGSAEVLKLRKMHSDLQMKTRQAVYSRQELQEEISRLHEELADIQNELDSSMKSLSEGRDRVCELQDALLQRSSERLQATFVATQHRLDETEQHYRNLLNERLELMSRERTACSKMSQLDIILNFDCPGQETKLKLEVWDILSRSGIFLSTTSNGNLPQEIDS